MRTVAFLIFTVAVGSPVAAQAQSAVARAQTLAQGAKKFSRAAMRTFQHVTGKGNRADLGPSVDSEHEGTRTSHFGASHPQTQSSVVTIEGTNNGHPLSQVISTVQVKGQRGTHSTSVESATVNGKTFSSYAVHDTEVGGDVPSRSGTWKSQTKKLGGLFSVRTKTNVLQFYDRTGAPKPNTYVLSNRKTLNIGPVPVMWLGRAMSKSDIASRMVMGSVTPAE